MLRRRAWPGFIVSVAGCLALGAMATTAVSIERTLWGKQTHFGFGCAVLDHGAARPIPGETFIDEVGVSEYGRVKRDLPSEGTFEALVTRAVGYADANFFVVDTFRYVRSGWPCLAFESSGKGPLGPSMEWAWEPPPWLRPLPDRADVPFRPIPLGFVADTLIYSAVPVLLLLVFGPPRRQVRRRKGLCPNCGYERSGIAAAAPCPECGTAPAA